MKKIIVGAALAASLAIGASASDFETLVKDKFDHSYVQLIGGTQNGVNDIQGKIGIREANFELKGITDYSISYSKENQFDANVKFYKAIDLTESFYMGTGLEKFNSENKSEDSTESKWNYYVEAGMLKNFTSSALTGGIFVGYERTGLKSEFHYSVNKDFRVVSKYEYSVDIENDNQHNFLIGTEFSF